MSASPTVTAAHFLCPSCQSDTLGHYCGQCGEKEVTDHDYSFLHLIREVTADLTSWDFKMFRSVWLLFSKPGFLSGTYFQGCRVRDVKPLQLFVILNVIYYFSLTVFTA